MHIHSFKSFYIGHIKALTSVCVRVHRTTGDISLSCVRSNQMHTLCKALLVYAAAGDDELTNGRCSSHQVCCSSKKKKKKKKKKKPPCNRRAAECI